VVWQVAGSGDEWVQSLSASGLTAETVPVKPSDARPYLRLDPGLPVHAATTEGRARL